MGKLDRPAAAAALLNAELKLTELLEVAKKLDKKLNQAIDLLSIEQRAELLQVWADEGVS